MNYAYYTETYKGKLEEAIFEEILPKAIDIMTMFANELCGTSLELGEYGLFKKAICYEVDCIHQFDLATINGAQGEQAITTVKTEGYTVEYSKGAQKFFLYKGLPMASMSKMLIENELKRNGHYRLLVD